MSSLSIFTADCLDTEDDTSDAGVVNSFRCCSFQSNITDDNYDFFEWISNLLSQYTHMEFSMYVFTCTVISVGLPLTLVAIYALYSQVRNGQVAPIYVINLLISDIIQLCCLTVEVTPSVGLNKGIAFIIYDFSLMASVGFMVCVALERYLVIAWPLWYRFRRTIKTSVVVCVVVWVIPLVCVLTFYFWYNYWFILTVYGIFSFLLPFPLFIFFLGGTLKALSASTVPSDEKRRIVGVLVLVLLIYTLLFMPNIIWSLSVEGGNTFYLLSNILVRSSPLADLFLYVFMRKGVIDKLLASVCCCRMDSNDISRSSGNDDNIHTVSSV